MFDKMIKRKAVSYRFLKIRFGLHLMHVYSKKRNVHELSGFWIY